MPSQKSSNVVALFNPVVVGGDDVVFAVVVVVFVVKTHI